MQLYLVTKSTLSDLDYRRYLPNKTTSTIIKTLHSSEIGEFSNLTLTFKHEFFRFV